MKFPRIPNWLIFLAIGMVLGGCSYSEFDAELKNDEFVWWEFQIVLFLVKISTLV